MKLVLFYIIVTISVFSSFAQRYKKVIKWEAKTASEGIVFGISKNKLEIDVILDSFEERNKDTKYSITNSKRKYAVVTIPINSKNSDPISDFKKLAPKGYKVLSAEDLNALHIIENNTLSDGVDYYTKARNAKADYAKSRLELLVNSYSKYMHRKTYYTFLK